MKVWVVIVENWSPNDGDATCSPTIDGIFASNRAALASTVNRVWNAWREFRIEEHEVKQ